MNQESNSLIIFTKASQMLAEADTIQKAKELKDLALTAADWAKRKNMGEEAIQYCRSYALEAERRMGEMLRETDRNIGTMPSKEDGGHMVLPPSSPPTLSELGLTKRESSEAQMLAGVSREIFDKVKAGEKSKAEVKRDIKREAIVEKLESIKARETKAIEGVYDVVVIDPPWPMEKIERDVAPNQVAFDYPTMTEEELNVLKIPAADDCHVWLWTTHRFMPMAFRLLETWGFKYVCCFTWHKPGGFQPWGLPQYNCEFILYARKGRPRFIDTKAFNVCFSAPRGKHSEKPGEFYDVIKRVTAGRRIDMFSRREIDGFDSWGNEV